MIGRKDSHEEPRVVVNDKRRIDPETGSLRDIPAPGSASADPGSPDNAGQPITATLAPSAELEAAQQEAAERTADLQRVTAEYANYRKRVDRDREQVVAHAKASVLTEMLTVLDDIDRADAHGDLTGAFKAVADRLTTTLQRLGLTQFGAIGDSFDPARHEAVQFATSTEVTEQTVTAVLRHGYSLGERLVRPATVAVTGPSSEEESGSGGSGGFAPDGGAPVAEAVGDADSSQPQAGEPTVRDASHGAGTGSSGGPGGVSPDGDAPGRSGH